MKIIVILNALALIFSTQAFCQKKANDASHKHTDMQTAYSIIVNITDDHTKIPDIDKLLPQEHAVGEQLKAQGFLEHLFLKDDKTGAILVFTGIDETKARELVATFPMAKYFDKVEYTKVKKEF